MLIATDKYHAKDTTSLYPNHLIYISLNKNVTFWDDRKTIPHIFTFSHFQITSDNTC